MSVIKKVIECGMEYEYILPYGNHVSFEMKDNTTIIVEYCGDSPDHTVCCWHEIERILFSHPFAECFARWLVENRKGIALMCHKPDIYTTMEWYLSELVTTPDKEREAFLASLVEVK